MVIAQLNGQPSVAGGRLNAYLQEMCYASDSYPHSGPSPPLRRGRLALRGAPCRSEGAARLLRKPGGRGRVRPDIKANAVLQDPAPARAHGGPSALPFPRGGPGPGVS